MNWFKLLRKFTQSLELLKEPRVSFYVMVEQLIVLGGSFQSGENALLNRSGGPQDNFKSLKNGAI